jgi:hypothetical protein
MTPIAYGVSLDGIELYVLWEYGDGPSLDATVKRLGGKACKMPLYSEHQLNAALHDALMQQFGRIAELEKAALLCDEQAADAE